MEGCRRCLARGWLVDASGSRGRQPKNFQGWKLKVSEGVPGQLLDLELSSVMAVLPHRLHRWQ